jgi:hypothetical protein
MDPRRTAKPTTLVADAALLSDVTIDTATIYWTNNVGEVWSVPNAGGQVTRLVATNNPNGFPSLAVNDDGLYFANGRSIARVGKQGGPFRQLATSPGK